MKCLLIGIVILIAFAASLSGQTLGEFQTAYEQFAAAVSCSLAATAATGLNWSPAYIGQFPHFGVGVTLGAAPMRWTTVKPVFDMLGVAIPTELAFNGAEGEQGAIGLPALAVDARIGGFGIPFDVGLKIGLLPKQWHLYLEGDFEMDYFAVGGDIRLAILKDEGLMPALSVGIGYSYMKGSIGMAVPGLTSQTIDITTYMNTAGYVGTYSFTFNQPSVTFGWQSNVIEARVQLSKRVLFLTPNIGLSAAYGISNAGGGLFATVTYSATGDMATEQQAAAVLQGLDLPVPSATGIDVLSAANGWEFRVYGGTSISILMIQLDLSVSYNILTNLFGGSGNVRFEL
ncbi:MAG: hypothetical protein ABSF77_15010 [Spirochaetia bacterium]|jgi:hypothetical protein